jgi:hypothetical protein
VSGQLKVCAGIMLKPEDWLSSNIHPLSSFASSSSADVARVQRSSWYASDMADRNTSSRHARLSAQLARCTQRIGKDCAWLAAQGVLGADQLSSSWINEEK